MESTTFLDISESLDRLAGDKELLIRLYELFSIDAPKKLSEIHHFSDKGELYQLERTAHSLKGAAATVGATQLHVLALHLEQAAKAQDMNQVSLLCNELDLVCNQTLKAMRTYNASP